MAALVGKLIQQIKSLLFLINPLIMVIRTNDGINIKKIDFNKNRNNCVVLGNGPSLNDDIENIKNHRNETDIICVNAFPLTDHFLYLKPEYLILMDTQWWRKDANNNALKWRKNLYNMLNSVNWKMQVIVSNNADISFVKSQIDNEYITVDKTKTVNLYRPLNSNAFKYYDTGYFGPPFTNVLVFAIYNAVMAGYKEIDLYGADLSYLFLIDVDQKTNKVFIKNEYFYETGERQLLLEHEGKDARGSTMYEFIQAQASTYKSHELLYEYARNKGIQIINRSSYSTIDAYPRSSA